MTTKGKLIAATLALLLVMGLLFLVLPSRYGVAGARSVDTRLTLYGISYIPDSRSKFAIISHGGRLKYQGQRVLNRLSIKSLPWSRVPPELDNDVYPGPGLIVHGRIVFSDSVEFELINASGKTFRHALRFKTSDGAERLLFWRMQLPNDRYHMRIVGETNELAVFELR